MGIALLKKLNTCMPDPLKQMAAPVIRAKLIYNTEFQKQFNTLEKAQYSSAADIEKMQFEKLKAVLIHAYEHVPYYHKIFDKCGHVAVELYKKGMSLKAIGDELLLNPIKVRKLLITAEVYKSEIAGKVKSTFDEYRETQDYKTALFSTATTFQLSRASVTSYLLYEKGVYFPPEEKDKISVGAERQRRYRAVKLLRKERTEEKLWNAVVIYGGVKFWTFSGLPFTYELRKGRSGEFTRELWIDRREHSKSLAWSSVLLAFEKVKDGKIKVERPKDLGDIRGVTYIYSLFLRFGLIEAAKNDKSQKSEK